MVTGWQTSPGIETMDPPLTAPTGQPPTGVFSRFDSTAVNGPTSRFRPTMPKISS